MPFLTVNGLTVPVTPAQASQERIETGGGAQRAYSGKLRREAVRVPRSWRFRTTLTAVSDLRALEGVLLGEGEHLPYDQDLFTAKGLPPIISPLPVATLRPGTAADGFPTDEGRFGGSVSVDGGTTNILSPTQRTADAGAPGNYTAVDGAILASSTSVRWQGGGSIAVLTSGAVNGIRGGIRTNSVVAPTGTGLGFYAASVYVFSPTAVTLRAFVRDATVAVNGPVTTKTLTPLTWTRFEGLRPDAGTFVNGHLLEIHVLEDTPDSGIFFFVDAWQLERGGGGDLSTAWVDGARVDGRLRYDSRIWDGCRQNFTWSLWFRRQLGSATYSSDRGLLLRTTYIDGRTSTLEWRSNVDLRVNLASTTPGTTFATQNYTVAAALPATYQVFHHVALVLRQAPLGLPVGGPVVDLYVNGALVDSRAVTAALDASVFGVLGVGCDPVTDSAQSAVMVDDLQILPWAATAAQVAGWYSSGRSSAGGPRIYVGGDALPAADAPLLCEAQLGPSSYAPHARGGTWQPSARVTDFRLEEV